MKLKQQRVHALRNQIYELEIEEKILKQEIRSFKMLPKTKRWIKKNNLDPTFLLLHYDSSHHNIKIEFSVRDVTYCLTLEGKKKAKHQLFKYDAVFHEEEKDPEPSIKKIINAIKKNYRSIHNIYYNLSNINLD